MVLSLFFHRQKGLRNSVEFGYALVGLDGFFSSFYIKIQAKQVKRLFLWFTEKHSYIHTRGVAP